MSRSKSLIRILLCLAVLGLLTAGFLYFESQSGKNSLDNVAYERRERAKDFLLPVIGKSEFFKTGDRLDLDDALARPLLIHFWASWCHVCREEKPDLDAFWKKHKDEDIVVLSIASFDSKQAMADSKLIETPTFTVLLDEDGSIANAYKVASLPVTVLVDTNGYIVQTFKGTLKPYDFAAIENYLSSVRKAH